MYKRGLMPIIFIIGIILSGARDNKEIKLKLLKVKTPDERGYIEIALSQDKRITTDGKGGTIFFDKNGRVIKRLKVGMRISRNGRYGGAMYGSEYPPLWTKDDSFVLYDSLGNKIWSITRGEDKGTIFHSRYGTSGIPPAHADIYISPDGSRVVGVEGFDAINFSLNDTFRIDFYGEGGRIIKEVKLPHPYYWQAGWSPDGKMFVISCPGNNPYGISRDDIIYAFDKDGKLLWKRSIANAHFIPTSFRWAKTLVITSKFIIQSMSDKVVKKHGIIILDYNGKLIDKLYANFAFYLGVSRNETYLVDWERWRVFLIDLEKMKILGEWRNKELFNSKKVLIKNCFFEGNDSLVIIKGFKKSKILKFHITKEERR